MAERTGIMVLIRRHWKSILAAGIAAVTVTALSVTTVTVATGGSIHIEGNGDLDITADSMIKSAGATDFLIQSQNDLDITAVGNGNGTGVITLTGEASEGSVNLVNGFASIRAENNVASMRYFGADEGGYLTVGAGGVSIHAMTTGDDISLAADDGLTLSSRSGAGADNYMSFNSLGITLWTEAGTEDYIYLSSGGGDIALSSFDDITLTATDDITATTESFSITATGTGNLTSTGILTIGGSDINPTATDDLALIATDDGSFYAGDNLTLTASTGPLIAIGGTGQLQIDANGLTVNGPVTSALVIGGSAYPVHTRLDFDNVVAAPGTTAETVLATQTLPASTMTDVGDGVYLRVWGITAMNTNAKSVRLRGGASGSGTGGSQLGLCEFNLAVDNYWYMEVFIYRISANTQRTLTYCSGGDATTAGTFRRSSGAASLTETSIIDLSMTVENATAAGDLTVNAARWSWL